MNNLNTFYFVQIAVCVASMLVMIFHIRSNTVISRYSIRWWTRAFILLAVVMTAEMVGEYLDVYPYPPAVHTVATAVEFILMPFIPVCLSFAVEVTKPAKMLGIAAIVHAAIEGVCIPFGGIFKITEDGVYEDGRFFPLYLAVALITLLYMIGVFVHISHRFRSRDSKTLIGTTIVILLGLAPFLIWESKTEYLGMAVAAILLYIYYVDLCQQDVAREVADTNSRMLALEDNVEVLYDVDLETAGYEMNIKGEAFKTVYKKMVNTDSFFVDMLKNSDYVVYSEDKLKFVEMISRDKFRSVLENDNHYDWYYRLLADGKPVWFRTRIVYKNENKRNVIFGVFNAEAEMAVKQTEMARLEAESANRAKSEFLFSMSHDIRTPLNSIIGYTDMALRHSDDPARVNESLNNIKVSGGHLLNIINDILEMRRIESGILELSETQLNIRELVGSTAMISRAQALSKGIEFETVVGDTPDPYIWADELHVNEVFINLISNAIKYTRAGGRVEFRVEQNGAAENGRANYRFTVSDNGLGMTEEFQEHLFDSFSNETTYTAAGLEGAGLGLSTTKKIIDLSGGEITVQSKPGEGSVFTVDLPFRVMDEEEIAAFKAEHGESAPVDEETMFRGRRALLVEDNEMNREIAVDILAETGLEIETAEDGAVAVAMVTEKGVSYYDFILMDIQMPVMDGYQATAEIRKLPGGDRAKIIAVSANAFKEDVEKSLAAGMNAHVSKPINVKNLFSVLTKYL